MESLYPIIPTDIDLTKIYWAFWQSREAYVINERLICLFKCETKSVDESGNPVSTLGGAKYTYKAFGEFSLYRRFKMSNGEYGIDKTRPLKTIDITSKTDGRGMGAFKQLGIFECFELYQNEKSKLFQ